MNHRGWIKSMPCAACLSPPPNDPHHVRTVGAMGHIDTDRYLVPLCRICHVKFHKMGASSFCEWLGLDLFRLAEMLWQASPYKPEPPPTGEDDEGSGL